MKKIGMVLAASISLAGCEATVSPLLMPMEPDEKSIAAPRRELTESEKDTISDAVTAKLAAANHREFKWAPLVLASHDHVTDFCGLVSGNDVDGDYRGFSKYYAWLTFDGKLSKVDVRMIAKSKPNELPTAVDSICMQDGYGGLPQMK